MPSAQQLNALRLDGFWSIAEALATLSNDIKVLLRLLGWRDTAGDSAQCLQVQETLMALLDGHLETLGRTPPPTLALVRT